MGGEMKILSCKYIMFIIWRKKRILSIILSSRLTTFNRIHIHESILENNITMMLCILVDSY